MQARLLDLLRTLEDDQRVAELPSFAAPAPPADGCVEEADAG